MSDVPNTPSPSHMPSTTTGSSSRSSSAPKPQVPTSLSEWQLMAVLQRANLLQYYEIFIAQGGDDINQIMQCDEHEFLEIMSLVGMLTKPLHVRRLQRTLTDFSKDPAAFNLAAIQHIGSPPVTTFPVGGNPMEFLLPGIATSLSSSLQPSTSPGFPSSESTSSQATNSSINVTSGSTTVSTTMPTTTNITAIDFTNPLSTLSATANVLSGDYLQSLVTAAAASQLVAQSTRESVTINTANSKESHGIAGGKLLFTSEKLRSLSPHVHSTEDFVSLGEFDPNSPSTETPYLSDAQVRRLQQCALQVVNRLPQLAPKLVQNKKRISKELLELMALPPSNPQRTDEYRKYSAIYGRFDAKRKPDKCLTLHEVSVNEAAAQICLLQPALLTRRDELFPLARQVVKDAGYHYSKTKDRKRTHDESSPRSSPSVSPPPCLADDGDDHSSINNSTSDEKRRRGNSESADKGSYLEKWAAGKLGQ